MLSFCYSLLLLSFLFILSSPLCSHSVLNSYSLNSVLLSFSFCYLFSTLIHTTTFCILTSFVILSIFLYIDISRASTGFSSLLFLPNVYVFVQYNATLQTYHCAKFFLRFIFKGSPNNFLSLLNASLALATLALIFLIICCFQLPLLNMYEYYLFNLFICDNYIYNFLIFTWDRYFVCPYFKFYWSPL